MRRRVAILVLLLSTLAGCGGGGGTDDEPIRYPPPQTLPPPAHPVPAWVPKRLAGAVEYRADISPPCHVVFGAQTIDGVPRGRCREALLVVDAFDRRYADTAICAQDICPPKTYTIRGWRCRISYFFDDAYTFTCRRAGQAFGFSGEG